MRYGSLIVGLMLVGLSCKETVPTNPSSATAVFMSARINDQTWLAGNPIAYLDNRNTNQPVLIIGAREGNGEEVQLFIAHPRTDGYILESNTQSYGRYIPGQSQPGVSYTTRASGAAEGFVSITYYDGKIVSGTFYFIAYNTIGTGTVSITEGLFRNIPVQDFLP